MRHHVALLAVAVVLLAACGDEETDTTDAPPEDAAAEVQLPDVIEEAPEMLDDVPEVDGPAVDWDGDVVLDVDFEALEEAVDGAFLSQDVGRGTMRVGTYSQVDVEVRAGELSDDELLAGCEELTDWLMSQPAEVAAGPLVLLVAEVEMDGDREVEPRVRNDSMILGEEPGSCELL